jgi:N-acetylglucosaminyl-diphospho-decaprenol L-rhamnosyltransferase
MSSPPVAIAVVSWNTRELLRRCLDSMHAEHDGGRAEVWVADNASRDGSPDMVEAEFPWVRILRNDENLGFGAAINEVVRRTDTPWIAPANADIELQPTALETLLRAGDSDRLGIVAPRLKLPDATTQHSVHSFPTLRLGLAFNLGLAAMSRRMADTLCIEGSWDPDRERLVDWAHGAFLLVRREAFDEVGGFDPLMWMYAEDLDLAWRLRRAGWLTRYVPDAVVRHEVSAATRQAFPGESVARRTAASYEWMASRRRPAIARAYAALNLAGATSRWAGQAVMARFQPRRWSGARDRSRMYARLHAHALRARAVR